MEKNVNGIVYQDMLKNFFIPHLDNDDNDDDEQIKADPESLYRVAVWGLGKTTTCGGGARGLWN